MSLYSIPLTAVIPWQGNWAWRHLSNWSYPTVSLITASPTQTHTLWKDSCRAEKVGRQGADNEMTMSGFGPPVVTLAGQDSRVAGQNGHRRSTDAIKRWPSTKIILLKKEKKKKNKEKEKQNKIRKAPTSITEPRSDCPAVRARTWAVRSVTEKGVRSCAGNPSTHTAVFVPSRFNKSDTKAFTAAIQTSECEPVIYMWHKWTRTQMRPHVKYLQCISRGFHIQLPLFV